MTAVEIIGALIAGYGIGILTWLSKRANKRARCGAHYWLEGRFEMYYRHCSEKSDHRCASGFCIVHCKSKDRCGGACLKEYAETLS
jgi:hypothetical protein